MMSPRPSEPTRHEQLSLPLVSGYKVATGEWPSVWGEAPAEYLAAPKEAADGSHLDFDYPLLKYAPPWALINWNPYGDNDLTGSVGLVVPKVFETCKLAINVIDVAFGTADEFEAGEDGREDYYDDSLQRSDGYALWWVHSYDSPVSYPFMLWDNRWETFTGTVAEKHAALYASDCRVKAIWWTED